MSRKSIYDLINKKAQRFKELRTNSSRHMTPEQIMISYMEAVEKTRIESEDKFDFEAGLDKASALMENRLKAFDPGVHVDVAWGIASDNWKDLAVSGIRITWSDTYISDNPDKEKEQNIDVGHMLLEGIFD